MGAFVSEEAGGGQELPLWQQQMRIRAFRLLGWSLPLMLVSFAVSSMIPHSTPKEIHLRDWGEAVIVKGRFDIPKKGNEEVQAMIMLDGPSPSPKAGPIDIRVKTLDGSFDYKKRWNFRPDIQTDGTWNSRILLKLPGGNTVAYRLKTQGAPDMLLGSKLHVVMNPARSVDRYLRWIEMVFYPSLVFCILAAAMLLFIKYSKR
jgi:hypothetical protein